MEIPRLKLYFSHPEFETVEICRVHPVTIVTRLFIYDKSYLTSTFILQPTIDFASLRIAVQEVDLID